MSWVYLVIAGLMEVVWGVGLKFTENFTRLWPSVWTIGAMIVSFFFLSKVFKEIPVGTAYAVWTGIGAVGLTIAGIILFDEPRQFSRLVCIGLIIAGIIGLKLTSN